MRHCVTATNNSEGRNTMTDNGRTTTSERQDALRSLARVIANCEAVDPSSGDAYQRALCDLAAAYERLTDVVKDPLPLAGPLASGPGEIRYREDEPDRAESDAQRRQNLVNAQARAAL